MIKQKKTLNRHRMAISNLLLGLLALSFTFSACKKDPPEQEPYGYNNSVFLLNEGNLNRGNASLSYLDLDNDSMQNEVFKKVNGLPFGDNACSFSWYGGSLWVVVTNSWRIDQLGIPTLKTHCQILGLTSPRYMYAFSNGNYAVSDSKGKVLHIVDPRTCTKVGEIPTGGWTEEMVESRQNLFVAQAATNKVLVFNRPAGTFVDSIEVGRQPMSIVQDQNRDIWVLCSGGLSEELPTLHRINGQTLQVEFTDTIGTLTDSPSELCMNGTKDRLYWLNGDVYSTLITGVWTPRVIVNQGSHNFYGLEINPYNNDVYVTDARDFQQNGQLFRIRPGRIDSFEVGINPRAMFF